MFREADSDGSGEMDIQELEQALITLGTRPSALELKHIVRKYDTNNSGSLSLDEARASSRSAPSALTCFFKRSALHSSRGCA